MEHSARNSQVLITDVGSFLGHELARDQLAAGATVWGLAKSHAAADLLESRNFTLLEIDLSQPLPSHLPQFDLVFFIANEKSPFTPGLSAMPHFSNALNNIMTLSNLNETKVALTLPIATDPEIYDLLAKNEQERQKLSVFLIGDLYGPGMDLKSETKLAHIISEAVYSDKVILENEGLDTIYPAYIKDVVEGIQTVIQSSNHFKKIHAIVSQSPQTALSVAYEVQKIAMLIMGKEIDLFFAGNGPSLASTQQITKGFEVDLASRTSLPEGLEKTFQYFKKTQPTAPKTQTQSQPLPTQAAVEREKSKLEKAKAQIVSLKNPKIGRRFKTPSSTTKKIAIIFLATFLIFIAKTTFDLSFGIFRLISAKNEAISGDFKNAQSSAAGAAGLLASASGEVNLFLSPFSLIFPQKTQSIIFSIDSAQNAAEAVNFLAKGASVLSANAAIIFQKDTTGSLDLESAQMNFKSSFFVSSRALALANLAKPGSMFTQINSLQSAILSINNLSQSAYEFASLISDITGSQTTKSYLLLLANNTELRPGGGFIGNIGIIDFKDGHLKNIAIDDVYNIDGQLKEKITPPPQLKEKLGTNNFYLRDSLWSPDFSLNAGLARDFFKKETGKSVDGVIYLDLSFLQEVLTKTGSVKLSDFNETITDKNIFEKGEYYSEVGFFAGSTQKRDFFGSLTRALITKTLTGLSSNTKSADKTSTLGLIEAFKDGLLQKHVMLTFDAPNLAAYVKTHDWNRPIPPASFDPGDDSRGTRDFLALSEANLGANKVNRFVDRKIEYSMTIGRDADLVANLKITYTNNSQADTWPGGKYTNFLRVYTPGLITLLSANGSEKIDPKIVQVATYGNLSAISTFVEVPPKSTKEVTFSYRLPKSIKLETAPFYDLYVQKQPGTNQDQFNFKFNLPGYLVTKSVNGQDEKSPPQNLDIKTDLLIDREFKVEVGKK